MAIAQLRNVRPHDLRHTYASILASEGISLPQIGALLGHTQASTTQRYRPSDREGVRFGQGFTEHAICQKYRP